MYPIKVYTYMKTHLLIVALDFSGLVGLFVHARANPGDISMLQSLMITYVKGFIFLGSPTTSIVAPWGCERNSCAETAARSSMDKVSDK